MNTQRLFVGVLVAILLVASASTAPTNETETNLTTAYNPTNVVTTLITSLATSNAQTTAAFTTSHVTSDPPDTSGSMSTAFTTTYSPTTASSSSPAITNTAPTTTTTNTVPTTTKTVPTTTATTSGRKFDGLSFLGGMILAAGLAGIIFLVVSYLRRNNRLPYANLQ